MVENDLTKVVIGLMDKLKSKRVKSQPNCGFLVPKTMKKPPVSFIK